MKLFTTKEEIQEFFRVLQHEDISFHPDKKFECYLHNDTQKVRYNNAEVTLRRTMLDKAFDYCKENNIDIYNLYRMACLQVDVEPKLREHFPILFELLQGERFDWKKINTKFSETHLTRLTNFIHGNNELIEANFFDVLTEHWKGNKKGTRMLNFFRSLLADINRNLDVTAKKKIKKTLYNILIEFDLNYLNYIGELAVLNLFIRNKEYKLNRIESPLGNKKNADFLFDRTDGNGSVLVEVVNVRPKVFPKNHSGIKNLFEEKFTEKNLLKTGGELRFLKYFLVPVVWGTSEELRRTADFLKVGTKINMPNVTELCAYCTFSDGQENGSIHKFGPLNTMFP